MEAINDEIAREFRFFRVYKDGRIEIFYKTQKVPPSTDAVTGVQSKDVTIQPEPAVSARIFLPKIHDPAQKLPVLLYLHGGGFMFESAFSPIYHNFVGRLAAEAHAIVVSVEYGLFPDRPLPACYEDSWAALKWLASHGSGYGTESWLNKYADFDRLLIGGDSCGANFSHYLAVRVGSIGQPDLKIGGVVLVHPFFGGLEEDDQMFLYICPENGGLEDRRLRPPPEDFKRLACGKMLIFFAAGDHLRGAGQLYYEDLKKSEWGGSVDVVEHGEGHVFHLFNSDCENAADLVKRFGSFINQK
ncbi:2-hydroxyisoflavanone dehydratase-like [Pyrus x bretschneideri]|uniref:2-hydroxyisoflavanone dehydratase-like n=1 Tax=Pyrus x bretschneideri TaxID=225117 RepID=UPI00202EC4AB|nr:2-hydroxyisoflavanone dehydratase-like [Pyrus x bretschneideri]